MDRSLAPAQQMLSRRSSAIDGALIATAALPCLLTSRLAVAPAWAAATWVLAFIGSCAWVLAGTVFATVPAHGRRLALFAIATTIALATPQLLTSPLLALSTLVAVAGVVAFVGRSVHVIAHTAPDSTLHRRNGRGAAFVSLALWAGVHLTGGVQSMLDTIALVLALSIPVVLVVLSLLNEARTQRATLTALAIAVQGLVVTLSQLELLPWAMVDSVVIVPLAVLLLPAPHAEDDRETLLDAMLGHPERLFVGTFASLCVAGTLALSLPQAAADGHTVDALDALFTAVSAVCVTGLVVLDTPTAFSATGQVMLLLLIQTGGLGIMTFSTAALRMFGGRMSLRHESAVASLISDRDRRQLYGSAQRILGFTLGTELLGAAWLTVAFMMRGDAFGAALWRAVFTSVSAFCNAGFALQTDSLIPYQNDPAVLHAVGALIVLGGLSPAAVFAIPALARRSPTPIALQIKLSLVATATLIVLGFTALLAFEWNHSLSHLTWGDRLHNAWFQSITLRTAGFNSVDLTMIQPATLSLMIVWMFIGGSPGGTAGGIKTTTAAILLLSVVHAIRGQWTVSAFGRRVAERSLRKATVVMTLAFSTVMVALIALQLTQDMPIEVGVFELVSALGTVGLSIGGTAALDGVGKLIVIACMFVGRVGGLSLLMFLSHRKLRGSDGYLEQEVDVG